LDNSKQLPHIDECRHLILKIVEQAVRDFLSLSSSSAPIERKYYETACDFLFDDNYRIDYGGVDKSLRDLLDILDYDVEWFRERIVKLKDKRIQESKKKRDQNAIQFSNQQKDFRHKFDWS